MRHGLRKYTNITVWNTMNKLLATLNNVEASAQGYRTKDTAFNAIGRAMRWMRTNKKGTVPPAHIQEKMRLIQKLEETNEEADTS